MLITSVKVTQLYGLHNYDIQFEQDACLKIIHAPNGYGKTTILKLIRAVLEGDMSALHEVPFKRFVIIFEDQMSVEVYKEPRKMIYRLIRGQQKEIYEVDTDQDNNSVLVEQLKAITQEMPIYFIDANRLWLEKKDQSLNTTHFLPTVLDYAKQLGELMREALAQSNYCGQELDGSFPVRLLRRLHDPSVKPLSMEEIKDRLLSLEEKRNILAGAGLYTKAPTDLPNIVEPLDERLRHVLSLYIEDSEEKLSAFEGLETKINLLCSLINKRFSYKVMEVNMKDGFVFKVPTNETLKADKLSSGEQNELILMYKLLFKAPANALILMDEPEISLHIAWQQNFLEDMEHIAKLSGIRIMIATHSPDIINGRWELTTGLEEEK